MSNSRTALKLALLVIGLATLCTACTPQEAASPAETGTSAESGPAVQTSDSASATKKTELAVTVADPVNQPRKPHYVDVTLPAGTEIEIELLDTLSSGVSQVGDPVRGRLSHDLFADGKLVTSAGAEVQGAVTAVVPLKDFGGQPSLTFVVESLVTDNGLNVPMVAEYTALGAKQAGRDAAKIGGGAVAGAILGHQVDDDKGKEIGALVGGAIGAAVAAKTGKQVELPAGTLIVVALEDETRVRVES